MKDVNCVAASWFRLADLYFTFSRNIICSLTEFWTKVRMGKLFLFVPSRVIQINLCPPFRKRLFVSYLSFCYLSVIFVDNTWWSVSNEYIPHICTSFGCKIFRPQHVWVNKNENVSSKSNECETEKSKHCVVAKWQIET